MLCRNARCRRNIPADAAAIRFQSSKGSRKPRRPPGHGSGNASERPLRPKRFAARSCRRPGPEVSETVRRRTIYVRPPRASSGSRYLRPLVSLCLGISQPVVSRYLCRKQKRHMEHKIGIFYGSSTGTTQSLAEQIALKTGVSKADTHDVADAAPDTIDGYDCLLLGSSTWGSP